MSLLNRSNGLFLLYCLALLGTTIPHLPLSVQSLDHNTETTLVGQTASTGSLSSAVGTSSGQAMAQVPIIQGWGGVTLDEASNGQMQLTLLRLNQSGYNGVRMGFSGSITRCSSGELGFWNPDWFNQTIQSAKQYNMWVVLDYHSYGDLVDSVCQTQWLSFWNSVISTNWGYSRIVWEPINEPAGSVSVLSQAYQAWITQARSLGDAHWIALENTISNGGCNFDPVSLASCYPVVTDPLNETFLSIHPYFFYDIWQSGGYGDCSPSATNTWSNNTAECVAKIYNKGMLQASSKYHMPVLDTEGGAVYYSCNNVCANPPDAIGTDDASYSYTTFHFIQYLTSLMQSENMGWLWWEAGEGSCCGALDTWGALLRFQPVNSPGPIDTAPILEAPSGESVIVGLTLSFKINASDPDIPLQNLTLSCFSCPIGASFPTVIGLGQVTGNFNWTPISSETGQHNLTFTVSDGNKSSSATILITVYPANGPPHNIPPVLIIPGNQTVTVASTVSFTVKATDIDIPLQTLALTCLDCASLSATFTAATGASPVTGTFNWDPSNNRVPGIYSVHFRVTDGINATGAVVPITVTKVNIEMAASVYPRTIIIGLSPVSASDTATLINGFNPTGGIVFNVFFSNASCTGVPLFTSTMLVSKNGNYPSQQFTPQAAGTYQWETSYTGDLNNFLAETQCGHPSEIMIVQPAAPTPHPQPPPPCQCNPSGGSSFLGSSIFWLAVGGIVGLVVVAVATISRKRTRRKLSS
jgi:hypothetical protein